MRIQREENLKQAIDYSQGQKDAAYCVLGEIVNLLGEFSDHMRIIGGWVPALLYPNEDHIGSIDVDVLLNQLEIRRAESYETIKRLLEKNGYRRHREKYSYPSATLRHRQALCRNPHGSCRMHIYGSSPSLALLSAHPFP